MIVVRLNSRGEEIQKSDVEALVLNNPTCTEILQHTVNQIGNADYAEQ